MFMFIVQFIYNIYIYFLFRKRSRSSSSSSSSSDDLDGLYSAHRRRLKKMNEVDRLAEMERLRLCIFINNFSH